MLFDPSTLDRWLAHATRELGDGVSYGLQTNGTLVTDEWISVIQRHDVRVTISLDGPAEIHDATRIDHRGRGSYASTVRGLRRLMEAGLDPGALCVINPAHLGLSVFRHVRSLGITHMSFLLPDATHDSKTTLYGPGDRTPVADYLIPIFDAWMDADDPHIRIRIFREIIRSILDGSGIPNSVGDGSAAQNFLVIDTDGSIQGSDVLKVCFEGAAESGLNVLTSDFDDLSQARPLVHQLLRHGVSLASSCQRCAERTTCGGGKVPHRYSSQHGFDNPSVWCADMLKLIRHVRARIGLSGCDVDPGSSGYARGDEQRDRPAGVQHA
jgi:uncharacterized protein